MENREIKFRVWDEFPKYEVGNDGSIYSLDYNHTGQRKELKQMPDSDGYSYVFLVVNGKRHKRSVHRMVALSFIDNPEKKPQVNHKNGIRYDNRVDNLEWVTSKENCIHAYQVNGRTQTDKQKALAKERFSGENNPKSKINEATVLSIRRLRQKGLSLQEISERHNISKAQVSAIARGKFWKEVENA